MSITDELREFAPHLNLGKVALAGWKEGLLAIADRIDTEHEKRIASVMNDALYHANEKDMADLGWIRLPKDADGQYIHIGDMMECEKLPNGERVCGEVKAISNDCVWLINVLYKIHAKYLRHHHKSTIEDVLREFGDKYCDMVAGSDKERELFAEYAAKLQLKAQ